MIALLAMLAVHSAHAEPQLGGEIVEVGEVVPPVLLTQAPLHYPEEAIAAQIHGDVVVQVHIDERGSVHDAEFIRGPEVFRAESLRAARKLQFTPATRNGQPSAAITTVHFHFAPPEHDHPEPVYTIVVGAETDDELDTHARQTLDADDLAQSSGEDLAGAIDGIAGVSRAGGSANTSKPMIRGQVERRLLLLVDGIRHESQKWGVDHAPEIDPFSAGAISVVKGAAGVRYGPDAIGGVILIEPPDMPDARGVSGRAQLMGASNGRQGYGALRVDAAPSDVLAFRLEGNAARSASLTTPDYVLGNTASTTLNIGGAAEYRPGVTVVRAVAHHFDQSAGVFYGIQNSTPADFTEQLEQPVNAEQWAVDARIDEPRQRVQHDLLALHVDTPIGSLGELGLRYAFQLNRREEWEQTRASIDGPQYAFALRTHTLDADVEHHSHALDKAGIEGGFGLSSSIQENVFRGLPLIPNHRSGTVGVYAIERLVWDRGAVELGARGDHLARTAYLTETSFERHQRRGTLDPDACTFSDGVAQCPRSYTAASVSAGGLWTLVPDHVDAKLDLSSASRAPNTDELLLNGSAPSFPVYALGTPDLKVETTWGASPTLGLRTPWLEGEVSTYVNLIERYVQFGPDLTETGDPAFDVTIRGAFPRYSFTPVNALFYGADGQAVLGPSGPLGLILQGSIVRAQQLSDGAHLVGIPADRATVTAVGRAPMIGPFMDSVVELRTSLIAKQSRVDSSHDFAPAPDGAVLLGAQLRTAVPTRHTDLAISLEASNLLNTRYREYLSLLRYYADQPGRDLRLRVGATF